MANLGIGAMGLLLLFGALVQYNDPDPWRWIVMYLIAAVATFSAILRPHAWKSAAVIAVIATVWCLALLPAAARTSFPDLFQSWEMMSTEMEEGRELGGLLLIAVWTGFLALRGRKISDRSAAEQQGP